LFGAINQLLAGLAFMVVVFYLWRRKKPVLFALLPMLIMLFMPAWAMLWQMFNPESGWFVKGNYLLFSFGLAILVLQAWMAFEAFFMFPRVKGVLEEALPPLPPRKPQAAAETGR
jgi:carbon starvation protein